MAVVDSEKPIQIDTNSFYRRDSLNLPKKIDVLCPYRNGGLCESRDDSSGIPKITHPNFPNISYCGVFLKGGKCESRETAMNRVTIYYIEE